MEISNNGELALLEPQVPEQHALTPAPTVYISEGLPRLPAWTRAQERLPLGYFHLQHNGIFQQMKAKTDSP